MKEFEEHFRKAKEAGLGVTLHIAEVRVVPRFSLQSLKYVLCRPPRIHTKIHCSC